MISEPVDDPIRRFLNTRQEVFKEMRGSPQSGGMGGPEPAVEGDGPRPRHDTSRSQGQPKKAVQRRTILTAGVSRMIGVGRGVCHEAWKKHLRLW